MATSVDEIRATLRDRIEEAEAARSEVEAARREARETAGESVRAVLDRTSQFRSQTEDLTDRLDEFDMDAAAVPTGSKTSGSSESQAVADGGAVADTGSWDGVGRSSGGGD